MLKKFGTDCRYFPDIYFSQGSVATRLRCDGIFNNYFIKRSPPSPTVKEFWKSFNIWRSYGQEGVGCLVSFFFDSRGINMVCCTTRNRTEAKCEGVNQTLCRSLVKTVKCPPSRISRPRRDISRTSGDKVSRAHGRTRIRSRTTVPADDNGRNWLIQLECTLSPSYT